MMFVLLRFLAAMLLACPLFGATTALANAAGEQRPAGPALWSVSDEDTTIYLFGTIHVLPEGTEWFDPRIAGAFGEAQELVTEIDLDDLEAARPMVAELAALEGGQTLRSLMNPEDRAQYEAALAALGVAPAALDGVEPWAAALSLTMLPLMQAGFETDAGVDAALTARAEGKQHTALETIEEQMNLFDSLPLAAQLELLDATVEAAPDAAVNLRLLMAEWLAGDADQLAEMMNDEMDDPVIYRRLLTDRNANWARWIIARLERPGTVFVAVGAGHLAGAQSVQAMLEAAGLTVARIEP